MNDHEYTLAWKAGFAAAVKAHATLVAAAEKALVFLSYEEDETSLRITLELALQDVKANIELGR